ncbi:MAG TPA: peptidase U32 family protein [Victivallales bacterium]|nr:peptidase U32 family protein [Victivallales bacterium]HRU00582.1 peptidase U32 family protein [Victivallales bacterium]
MSHSLSKVEICAPVGSLESLAAAINGGANSIYFGAGKLNMRSHSSANFAKKDIPRVLSKCRKANVKSYLALNSIIYDDEYEEACSFINIAKELGVSAVILSDLGLMEYAHSIGISVHVSVQMNVANFATLKYLSRYADVFVLARELSLRQVSNIASRIESEELKGPSGEKVRLELFIHGALCVAVAGTCGMSLFTYGKSSMRGECYQNCRRRYRVYDDETGNEFVVDNQYIMSPKDLCCIRILDKIIESGVSILKIEGRGRSPDYVYKTTKVYSEALRRIKNKSFDVEFIKEAEKELSFVYNRGFWHGGYYLGDRSGEWSAISGGKNVLKKVFAGKILNYFPKASCAEANLQSEGLKIGDLIMIIGPTTGCYELEVKSLRIDNINFSKAKKGETVTFPVSEKVRKGDKLYILKNSQ